MLVVLGGPSPPELCQLEVQRAPGLPGRSLSRIFAGGSLGVDPTSVI